jgi:hypothetical protein
MMIETMVAALATVAPMMSGKVSGGAVMPSNAQVTSTALDGNDGAGVWLWHKTLGYGVPRTVRVADRKPYPSGRADSVRRPGFNGKAWSGETFIGGVDTWAMDTGEPGADAYGARGHEGAVANIRVGPYVVGVNPFEEIRAEGKEIPRHILSAMEDARNEWLRDHGYVGGVRSFTNDTNGMQPKQAIDLTPKAVIPAPTDLPRTRSRMEVRSAAPMMKVAGATRVSLPPSVAASVNAAPRLAAK